MKNHKTMKKLLSILLAFCMMVQYLPMAAFAVEAGESGLCEHHPAHTAECGYVEEAGSCTYHCDICLGHSHGDEEDVEEEEAEEAAGCTCGTDDPAIHATNCPQYAAPAAPECFCAEKCTEANIWCDVCGFDPAGCTGADAAAVYEDCAHDSMDAATGLCGSCGENVAAVTLTAGGVTTYYADFTSAMAALAASTAEGTTEAKLVKNTTYTCESGETLPVKTFVIDLNGFELTTDSEFTYPTGSVVTIRDSSAAATGKLTLTGTGAHLMSPEGNLTLESGAITHTKADGLELDAPYGYYSNFTMTGGSITGAQNGIVVGTSVTAEISGGTIAGGTGYYAIKTGSNGCNGLDLSGGTFMGGAKTGSDYGGLVVMAAIKYGFKAVDLEGNDISESLYQKEYADDFKVICVHGTSAHTTATDNGDGTHSFTCTVCLQDAVGGHGVETATGLCPLCGGSGGASTALTIGGVTTYYADFNNAVTELKFTSSESPAELKLLKNVTHNGADMPNKTYVLDMNGFELTTAGSLKYVSGSNVTLRDSSAAGTGKIILTSYNEHQVNTGATVTMESGTVEHVNRSGFTVYAGTFKIAGGSIISRGSADGINLQNGATIIITGGTMAGGEGRYALSNPSGAANISIAGGTFVGGANTMNSGGEGCSLGEAIVDGCTTWDQNGNTMNLENSSGGECSVTFTVICPHTSSAHTTAANKGDGTHVFTCTVCGSQVVEKHTDVVCTSGEDGTHSVACSTCGSFTEPCSYNEKGRCTQCGYCLHSTYENGICAACGEACPHNTQSYSYVQGKATHSVDCEDCGLTGIASEYHAIDTATGKCTLCGSQSKMVVTIGDKVYGMDSAKEIFGNREYNEADITITLFDDMEDAGLPTFMDSNNGDYSMVLELNGHTFDVKDGDMLASYKRATIKDSSPQKTGRIVGSYDGVFFTFKDVTLEGGTIENLAPGGTAMRSDILTMNAPVKLEGDYADIQLTSRNFVITNTDLGSRVYTLDLYNGNRDLWEGVTVAKAGTAALNTANFTMVVPGWVVKATEDGSEAKVTLCAHSGVAQGTCPACGADVMVRVDLGSQGTAVYATWNDATRVTEASGVKDPVITLLADADFSESDRESADICPTATDANWTIDLAGHDIKVRGWLLKMMDGSVTIKAEGSTVSNAATKNSNSLVEHMNGTLTLEGGTWNGPIVLWSRVPTLVLKGDVQMGEGAAIVDDKLTGVVDLSHWYGTSIDLEIGYSSGTVSDQYLKLREDTVITDAAGTEQTLPIEVTTGEVYTITNKSVSLAGAVVTVEGTHTYTGSAITPNVTVTVDGTALASDMYTVAYSNNVNAGTASVTVTGIGGCVSGTAAGSFVIGKADPAYTAPAANTGLVYSGSALALAVPGSEGMLYSLDGQNWSSEVPTGTNAGEYTVSYKLEGGANHNSVQGSVKVTIGRAEPEFTAPAAKDLTYSGSAQALVAAGTSSHGAFRYSQDGQSWSTEVPTGTDAGSYTVYHEFIGDENHLNADRRSVEVSIARAELNILSQPTVLMPVYNGQPLALVAAGAVENGTMEYSLDGQNWSTEVPAGTNAGSYPVWYRIEGGSNYKSQAAAQLGTAVIQLADASVTAAPTATTFTYNGGAQALVASGTAAGGRLVYSLEEEGSYTAALPTGTNAGEYTVWYKLVGDENHTDTEPAKVEVSIAKAALTVAAGDAAITYGDAPADPAVTYSGFVGGQDESVLGGQLVCAHEYSRYGDVGSYAITPGGLTSGNYAITYEAGTLTVAPKGITVAAAAQTKTYGEADPQLTYSVEGLENNDKMTGALAREEGENAGSYAIGQGTLTAGGNYTVSFTGASLTIQVRSLTVAANAQTITYGESIDTDAYTAAGLVSGHSVAAALSPSTAKVTAGGTITASSAAVADENGTDVTANYSITYTDGLLTIQPDTTGLAGITAENVTSADREAIEAVGRMMEEAESVDPAWEEIPEHCTQLLEKIEAVEEENDRLADAAAGYDLETVKTSDKADVEQLIDDIEEQLATDNLTEEERTALEESKAAAEEMVEAIEKAEDAANTENIGKVEDIAPDTVTPEDKTDLEAAKDDLEKALEENSGNYTEEEKQQIREELDRIEEALDVIEKVEETEEVILDLADPESPDDADAVEAIEAAKEVYDALSEYEKSLVDQTVKAKLDSLLADIADYELTKGHDSRWKKGRGDLEFVGDGLLRKFVELKVDGVAVGAEHYGLKAGSTIVTLKAGYLGTLSVGEHTITLVYTDGEAEGTFHIDRKKSAAEAPAVPGETGTAPAAGASPATGDESSLMMWSSLMGVCIVGLAALSAGKKRRITK